MTDFSWPTETTGSCWNRDSGFKSHKTPVHNWHKSQEPLFLQDKLGVNERRTYLLPFIFHHIPYLLNLVSGWWWSTRNSVQSLGVSPCHCARVPPRRLGLQWQDLQLRNTRVKAKRQVLVIEKSFCKHFTLEPARILAMFWFKGHCYNREPTQCVGLASIRQLSCAMVSTRSSDSLQIMGSLVLASLFPHVPSATFRDVTSCWWRNKSACSPNKSQQQLEAWNQMELQTCKEQKQLKTSSFSIFCVTHGESFWSFICHVITCRWAPGKSSESKSSGFWIQIKSPEVQSCHGKAQPFELPGGMWWRSGLIFEHLDYIVERWPMETWLSRIHTQVDSEVDSKAFRNAFRNVFKVWMNCSDKRQIHAQMHNAVQGFIGPLPKFPSKDNLMKDSWVKKGSQCFTMVSTMEWAETKCEAARQAGQTPSLSRFMGLSRPAPEGNLHHQLNLISRVSCCFERKPEELSISF